MELKTLFNNLGQFTCDCKKCKCYKCGAVKTDGGAKAVQVYRTTRRLQVNEYRLIDVYTCLKCKARWEEIVSEQKYAIPPIQENPTLKKKSRLLKDYNSDEINVNEIQF